MTPEELAAAEKAAWALFPGGECDHADADGVCLLCAAEVVRAAEARGRERGIEEAARQVEACEPAAHVTDAAKFLVTRSMYARRVRYLLSGNATPQATPPATSVDTFTAVPTAISVASQVPPSPAASELNQGAGGADPEET